MYPQISIIVPCYNVERFLDRCLNRLTSQLLNNIEIILVDDVSLDSTPQKCDEWAEKDIRIKVIHKSKNEGLGYARNTGLEIAKGEYVAFVDSDDFVDYDMFEKLYHKASEHHLDIVFCGFKKYHNGKIVTTINEVENYVQYDGADCQKMLEGMVSNCGDSSKIVKYEMSVWHGIYKREVIEKNQIMFCSERQFCSEDILFHIDLIKECNSIGIIPDALYYYCYNGNSLTKIYREDRLERHDILFKEILRRIESKQYNFDSNVSMNLFLLKIRYDITIIASYGFDKMTQKSKILEIVNSDILHNWLDKIKWRSLPIRYICFYLLVKMKMISVLNYLINKE